MKKVFTLLTLALLSIGTAWADDVTIFSMTAIDATTVNVAASGTANVTATFNAGSSAQVYNGKGSAQDMIKSSQINLGGSSNSYFHATFTTALAAGDEITSSTENTFYISGTSSKPSSEITFPYTIKSTDTGLIGKTDLYVWKKSGSTFTSFTITRSSRVATPTLSFSSNQVTMECATAGATIHYTIDGSTPTSASTAYSSAVTLPNACTVRAIAIKAGSDDSNIAKKECYVNHSSVSKYLTSLGYNGGTVSGDVWTGTNFTITNNVEGRGINSVNLAGTGDGFKLNHTDNYTIQPSEGIKVTKLVVVGKTWLKGDDAGNAATIAFDDWTPASGTFFDYLTDGETYVKTIEFTPSTEQTFGQAITMRPGNNQVGAYIEVYGDIKTYTITYDKGTYGTGTIAAGEKTHGVDFTLSSNKFTRDGFVQTGWATLDGGPQIYALGATYTANAAITLYPVWSKIVANEVNSWDFTNWSDATKTDVLANTEKWNQYERADNGGANFENNGRSNVTALSNNTLTSTAIISEANGLKFTAAAYGLGLMFNMPSTTIGTYHGSQYLWLYSSTSTIKIPSVPANAVIEIGVESHKDTEARGVTLKNGSTTLTQTLGDATSMTYQVCKWTNTSTEGDVVVTPSKGLHTYYITVTEYTETVPVSTKSGNNYGSFVATKKLDFGSAEGITAYIATELTGAKNAVLLQSIGVVDAGTPIIVKTDTKGATVNVPVTTAAASTTTGNLLRAGDGSTSIGGAGVWDYILSGDMFHHASAGELPVGKAYLHLTEEAAAGARELSLIFEDEEATGIRSVDNGKVTIDNVIYDLSGRRVANPTKGLYIVNGKKVILK